MPGAGSRAHGVRLSHGDTPCEALGPPLGRQEALLPPEYVGRSFRRSGGRLWPPGKCAVRAALWNHAAMDFSDALRAMKQGRKVRRDVWPVPSSVQAYASLEIASPGGCDPCFVCTYNDGTRAVMHVSAYHMLECDDWELC